MFNWVHSFLSGHTIQFRIGSVLSDKIEMENGTPQTSVISPILFLIAINDFRQEGVKV